MPQQAYDPIFCGLQSVASFIYFHQSAECVLGKTNREGYSLSRGRHLHGPVTRGRHERPTPQL